MEIEIDCLYYVRWVSNGSPGSHGPLGCENLPTHKGIIKKGTSHTASTALMYIFEKWHHFHPGISHEDLDLKIKKNILE